MTVRSAKPLTCGDAVVGFVAITGYEMPWTLGEFAQGPAYSSYAALFERERALNNAMQSEPADECTASDAWLDALEEVNQLGLRLDGSAVRDFKIDQRGECEFKLDQ